MEKARKNSRKKIAGIDDIRADKLKWVTVFGILTPRPLFL